MDYFEVTKPENTLDPMHPSLLSLYTCFQGKSKVSSFSEEVSMVRGMFPDVAGFDKIIGPRLDMALADPTLDFRHLHFRNEGAITAKQVALSCFSEKDLQDGAVSRRVVVFILSTLRVLCAIREPIVREQFWTETRTLLERYPNITLDFGSTDIPSLMRFRNAVVAALNVFNPERNHSLILHVASRIESCQSRDFSGTGRSGEIAARIFILREEAARNSLARPGARNNKTALSGNSASTAQSLSMAASIGTVACIEPSKLLVRLQSTFSDVGYFEELVEPTLKKALRDIECGDVLINVKTVKTFARMYYGRPESVAKDSWVQIQSIFATCCVMIVGELPEVQKNFICNESELLQKYPKLADAGAEDLALLVRFYNWVCASLHVVYPERNKGLILYIAGHLEGARRKYTTGSCMSAATRRRLSIIEGEAQQAALFRSEYERNYVSVASPTSRGLGLSVSTNESTSAGSGRSERKRKSLEESEGGVDSPTRVDAEDQCDLSSFDPGSVLLSFQNERHSEIDAIQDWESLTLTESGLDLLLS